MKLVKWDPIHDVGTIRDDIDRIFDGFFGKIRPGRTTLDSYWTPLIDLEETEDSVRVRAELPGMKKDEIKISLDGDHLHLSGERKQEKEEKEKTYHRIERSYGRFERVIPLPTEVEKEKVKAVYTDGVLQITLPKSENVKPKEIAIDVK
jgi:HSP20 family protein